MSDEDYKYAVNLSASLLSGVMPPNLSSKLITKVTYKLFAGFEALGHDGNLLNLYPVGQIYDCSSKP